MPTQPTCGSLPHWLIAFVEASERIAALPVRPTKLSDLMAATALPRQLLVQQLRLAGWRQQTRQGRAADGSKRTVVWWSPPGQSAPRTPRSTYDWLAVLFPDEEQTAICK